MKAYCYAVYKINWCHFHSFHTCETFLWAPYVSVTGIKGVYDCEDSQRSPPYNEGIYQ